MKRTEIYDEPLTPKELAWYFNTYVDKIYRLRAHGLFMPFGKTTPHKVEKYLLKSPDWEAELRERRARNR